MSSKEVLRCIKQVVPHVAKYESHRLLAELRELSPAHDGTRVSEDALKKALHLVEVSPPLIRSESPERRRSGEKGKSLLGKVMIGAQGYLVDRRTTQVRLVFKIEIAK